MRDVLVNNELTRVRKETVVVKWEVLSRTDWENHCNL